jgi:hypothetical protein
MKLSTDTKKRTGRRTRGAGMTGGAVLELASPFEGTQTLMVKMGRSLCYR